MRGELTCDGGNAFELHKQREAHHVVLCTRAHVCASEAAGFRQVREAETGLARTTLAFDYCAEMQNSPSGALNYRK